MSSTSPVSRPSRSSARVTSSSPQPKPESPVSRSSPTPGTPAAQVIAKGGSARAAVSPRVGGGAVSTPSKRASLKLSATVNGNGVSGHERQMSREVLTATLKKETDEKEDLLLRVQNHEQTITSLITENTNLSSALTSVETRLAELYADQGRMEDEMAGRLEVVEKLRDQIKELEKEKRDAQRRYKEQSQTFDAERQAFYDNEQHLKSRIQTLTRERRSQPSTPSAIRHYKSVLSIKSEVDDEESVAGDDAKEYEAEDESANAKNPEEQDDESSEPAEMTSLRLELSTLATSHASLQNTMHLLQTELLDLKRVNNELQEENESYNILLREKTLSGQMDLMRNNGADSPSSMDEQDDDRGRPASSIGKRSTLDVVSELDELDPFNPATLVKERDRDGSPSSSTRASRKGSRRSMRHEGESLGDLPITGPGLDLAAELGRAESKDILEGNVPPPSAAKVEKSEKDVLVDSLRIEVKQLKEANKALSLYASKIIDRIISQKGFEHVLAVDYDDNSAPAPAAPTPPRKTRAQSIFGLRGSGSKEPISPPPPTSPPSTDRTPETTRTRRALSMDWKSFSFFGGGNTTPDPTKTNPALRPLTLKPGTPSSSSTPRPDPNVGVVIRARKLETYEDEDDRKERERLKATMQLMGIDMTGHKSLSEPLPSSADPNISPGGYGSSSASSSVSPSPLTARPPLPRGASEPYSSSSSPASAPLTSAALEEAQAAMSLATLDMNEKVLSAEYAKGSPGATAFTELAPRRFRSASGSGRRSTSGNSSVSTVWSAGRASTERGFDEEEEEKEKESGGKSS